jgi:hypothetical protein
MPTNFTVEDAFALQVFAVRAVLTKHFKVESILLGVYKEGPDLIMRVFIVIPDDFSVDPTVLDKVVAEFSNNSYITVVLALLRDDEGRGREEFLLACDSMADSDVLFMESWVFDS